MAISWRDAMSIDGGQIDDDHRHLFSLINEIERLLDGEFDVKEILVALKKLQYYTVYHFAREEAIQKQIGYAEWEEHAEKHRLLVANVGNAITVFEKEIAEYKHDRIRDNVLRLLQAWIVGHVLKHDIPMRSQIRNHRMGPRRGPISTG